MLNLLQIKAKVNLVQGQYMEQLQKADKKFIDLQAHEMNTGTGLIYSKKGKPISDKVPHLNKEFCEVKMPQMLSYYSLNVG